MNLKELITRLYFFPLSARFLSYVQKKFSHIFSYLLYDTKTVSSISVAGSMARGDYIPGASDIDLVILLKDAPEECEFTVAYKMIQRFKKINFFLRVGSLVHLLSGSDSALIENISKFTYIFNPWQWRILAGSPKKRMLNLSVPPNHFGLICNAKMWHESLLSLLFSEEGSRTNEYRKFYSNVFKICRSLSYATRPLDFENIYDSDPYSFIPQIRDPLLQRWCQITQNPKSKMASNKDFYKQLTEVSARALIYLNELAHEYLNKKGRNGFSPDPELMPSQKRSFANDPGIINHHKKIVSDLSEIRRDISSIIWHQSKYYIILRPNLPIGDIQKDLIILNKKKYIFGNEQNFKVSMPHLFYLQITTDPWEHMAFTNSSEMIFDDNPQMTSSLLHDPGHERIYINLAYLVFAKNYALCLGTDPCKDKLTYILKRLLAQRIFFEKNIIALEGEELRKYRECFSDEQVTAFIANTLTQASKTPKNSNQKTKISIIHDLYLSINHIKHLIHLR